MSRPHPFAPRLARAAAVLALLAATGCTAKVQTRIEVTGPDAALVSVAAVFTGQAAQTLAREATARSGLIGLFEDRLGETPQLEVSTSRVRASAEVDYADLAGTAAVTGVAAASLAGGDTLRVDLVAPKELVAAIRDQVASEPDAGPLAQTMLEETLVTVTVVFPGGVDDAQVHGRHVGGAPVVTADTVTVSRTAAVAGAGTLTVVGDPTPSLLDRARDHWAWFAAAGAALGAGLWFRRR